MRRRWQTESTETLPTKPRTTNGWLLVFLKVVVHKSEDKRGLLRFQVSAQKSWQCIPIPIVSSEVCHAMLYVGEISGSEGRGNMYLSHSRLTQQNELDTTAWFGRRIVCIGGHRPPIEYLMALPENRRWQSLRVGWDKKSSWFLSSLALRSLVLFPWLPSCLLVTQVTLWRGAGGPGTTGIV